MDEVTSPWRKSTYSAQGGSSCVEIAATGEVLIRDTTDRGGVTLSVPAATWATFLSDIK
jgi:hypothetical protein